MSDAAVAEEAPRGPSTAVEPEPPAHAAGVWGVRCWISAALFLLVVLCFALPFASTSCSVPGGFGRGAAGSSTVYRGLDIALDAVPAVNPPDKPTRPEALPNDGQLGFQPLALLALLVAIAGVPLSLLTGRRGARTVAAWAAVTAALLIFAQLEVRRELTDRIVSGLTAPLPSGKTASSYVGTGFGFLGALALLGILAAVNLTSTLWQAVRASRAPAFDADH
ncbi:MAG TPA: hypothetical protein VKI99_06165 [Candidatus Dormibacteraeota bacterium]|nr:hypothetical protein [Candidatus Dormibacteraeota bacterium]